jgi:cold-inducible RNA-binding protein
LRLFVANIAWSATSEELRELFSRYGRVASCIIIADKETGRSRGFGFVQMDSDAEAQHAIDQLNGYVLGGRNLRVNEALIDRRRAGRSSFALTLAARARVFGGENSGSGVTG